MPVTVISVIYMTVFLVLGTFLGINIAIWLDQRKEKKGHTLQEQIESLDCDAVNLRMQQDTLRSKLDRLGERMDVNIHHVHQTQTPANERDHLFKGENL